MTDAVGPTNNRRLQIAASSIDVNMKVTRLETVAEAVDGVATFAFHVMFRAKERPEESDEAFEKSELAHKIYVHAENLDEALQMLHVMGHKFKEMNRGELQHHMKHNFSQIKMERMHSKEKGTSFRLASSDIVSGEVKYEEIALSSKELQDLHTYAGYLKSDKAYQEGVVSPEAQIELEKKDPYAEVRLERDDAAVFRVSANRSDNIKGTTITATFPSPVERQKGEVLKALAQSFVEADDSKLHLWQDFVPEASYHFSENLDAKTMMQQAIDQNVEQAKNELGFDAQGLEEAYKAFQSAKDEASLILLLDELSKYNEQYDVVTQNGLPKVRSYQKKAFLEEAQTSPIQKENNKIGILKVYEKAFPGITQKVSGDNKGDKTEFTEEEFKIALKELFDDEYGAAPEGVKDPKLIEVMTDGETAPVNVWVSSLINHHLFLPLSFMSRDREDINEEKRNERDQKIEEAIKLDLENLETIKGWIAQGTEQKEKNDQEVQEMIKKWPEKAGFLSKEDRLKKATENDHINLQALVDNEEAFLKAAFKKKF